jgi:hypothetical protein
MARLRAAKCDRHRPAGQARRRALQRRRERWEDDKRRRDELPAHDHRQWEIAVEKVHAAQVAIAQKQVDQASERDRKRKHDIEVIRCREWLGPLRQAKRAELQPVESGDGEEVQKSLALRHRSRRQLRLDMSRAPKIPVVKRHRDLR